MTCAHGRPGGVSKKQAQRPSVSPETYHEGLKVGRPEGDCLERLVDDVQQLAARGPLVLTALAELADELGRDVERRAKLDDSSAAEFVGVEVRQADRDDLQAQVWVGGHRAEGHDRYAGLERKQIGSVVGASCAGPAHKVIQSQSNGPISSYERARRTLGKDAQTLAVRQMPVDPAVHLLLVDVREDLEGLSTILQGGQGRQRAVSIEQGSSATAEDDLCRTFATSCRTLSVADCAAVESLIASSVLSL